jgi:hypothetical protein
MTHEPRDRNDHHVADLGRIRTLAFPQHPAGATLKSLCHHSLDVGSSASIACSTHHHPGSSLACSLHGGEATPWETFVEKTLLLHVEIVKLIVLELLRADTKQTIIMPKIRPRGGDPIVLTDNFG